MSFLTGLIGHGIAGSLSPRLHEAEAAALGLTLVYRILETDPARDDVAARLAGAQAFGFDGVNVTHPFKQAVIAHLARLSPDAKALGAVNTVVFDAEGPSGHNTDWRGFGESLRIQIPDGDLDAVAQIGAGGAGAAVAYALLKAGATELRILDADPARSLALAARMESLFPARVIRVAAGAREAVAGASGVVQATPVGMGAHPGLPFDPDLLDRAQWVVDIIYFPRETALLKAARAKGCRAFNGLGMVAYQGAAAFELFTGRAADPERILGRLQQLDLA